MSKAVIRSVKNRSAATVQTANVSGGGKTTGQLVRASNQWRDNYNPLRGLVIARVVFMMEAAARGDYAELELTLKKIEMRFPVLKGLKTRRTAALEELDWDIKIKNNLPPGATEAMAKAQQTYLRSRYDLVENLTEVFSVLTIAEFRGFAILQKHRYEDGPNDGAVRELHWLPQWTFSRDGEFGDFYYNQDSRFGIGVGSCQITLGEKNRIGSVELPREEFVIRTVEDPLYEIALIAFVNWAMARKDYAAFVEIFGLPNGVVIMPANIPQGKENDYQGSAERVADGVSGALPNGSDIKFPTAGFRNNGPFKEFCDVQDADVVLAGTGGRLSMLAAEKGSHGLGNGPSAEHADAFNQIARADARKVNEVLQRDFDRLELAAQFPNQPQCVYFELAADEGEDVKDFVANVNTLALAGKNVETDFIAEKTGYEFGPDKVPTLDPNLDQPADPLKNRDNPPVETDDVATTLQEMFLPLTKRLDAIAKITDASIQQHMIDKLLSDYPQIGAAIKADNSLAKQLSPQLEDSLIAGLNQKPTATP